MYGSLTPEQAALLAQAGVKIDFTELKDFLDCGPREVPMPVEADIPLRRDLFRRMKWGVNSPVQQSFAGEAIPVGFTFVAAHKAGDRVIVMLVRDDKLITFWDEWALYPSDTLITKIRLLETP